MKKYYYIIKYGNFAFWKLWYDESKTEAFKNKRKLFLNMLIPIFYKMIADQLEKQGNDGWIQELKSRINNIKYISDFILIMDEFRDREIIEKFDIKVKIEIYDFYVMYVNEYLKFMYGDNYKELVKNHNKKQIN